MTLGAVISEFGAAAKAKLSNPAITGAPEDQLRGPLETLFKDLAEISGMPANAVHLVGETSMADLKTRPDFAVTVNKALVGFIEVKAPGKGADPRKFNDPHDREQWEKLKALPNLIYTDGNAFSLWRDGEIVETVVALEGDIESSGTKLAAPPSLLPLISDFLRWDPIPPKSAPALARVCARLCRLLRDEVVEEMEQGSESLTALAKDWRKLLFPEADDAQFADGYAQAVTFGLLVARARQIPLKEGIHQAAHALRQTNSLIGTALGLLTDDASNQASLKTSLGTLTRVLDAVDWAAVSKDDPDAWLYFYERFLEVYDNELRKKTGSYYTPPEVVTAMVRLVDEAVRGPLFERSAGFASSDVTVADPAVGTGTFLLGILRQIARTVSEDQGPGAVKGAIEAAAQRIIGFEKQFGPFAVAQLRVMAEMQSLMQSPQDPVPAIPELRLFITDTLGNPFVGVEDWIPLVSQPIAKSRQDANAIKRSQPITVVIGNPPYKEKAEGKGSWVESGSSEADALLKRWMPPTDWSVGTHTKHLRNLYVYFWRWATWKVFGAGLSGSTVVPNRDEEGIVCFITVAGFLNGPGFQKMRDDLRRTCSDIWVIDCSPEGHQPAVSSRIFQAVQQPVCIVLAARQLGKADDTPARVRFRSLQPGNREDKFVALNAISLNDHDWKVCSSDWRAPFLPAAEGAWSIYPALKDLFLYDGSGVMPGRTWIIAPDAQSLKSRWLRLIKENDSEKKEALFHPHLRGGKPGDKHVNKEISRGLAGNEARLAAVADDNSNVIEPIRYGFRTLDRQWIIPDARLINQPNPKLWGIWSPRQVYLTALDAHSPTSGPAITFTNLIPDLHHYKGSFGGRARPLWSNAAATEPNISPTLLEVLADTYNKAVAAEDVMAYLAAVMAHPAFTARFSSDLVQPGLRVPLTADGDLFAEASALGREVVWLHCYGERFADPNAGRPKQAPRLPKDEAPYIPEGGSIPGDHLPQDMDHDASKKRLRIGKGYVENVTQAMWDYEVSGMNVLKQWFSYRRADRSRPIIGDRRPPSPLSDIQPEGWLAEYTTDLLDLLNVLGRLIKLEPAQTDLLNRICDGPLLTKQKLDDAQEAAQAEDAETAGDN
ncbi:MAG: type ISP restriction/modification enzyme [Hyphomicrobiales bacterium]